MQFLSPASDVDDPVAGFVSSYDDLRVLRVAEICSRLSISVSTLYVLIGAGVFPPLVAYGLRARGLPEPLVDAWLWSRLEARAAMSSLRDPAVFRRWDLAISVPSPISGICMLVRSEVERRVQFGKSHIYDEIALHAFPAPAAVSPGARRWAAHEVAAWLRARTEQSLREAKTRVTNVYPLPPSSRRRS